MRDEIVSPSKSLYQKAGPPAVIAYQLGDRVRIGIPDETNPDFELHSEHELVIAVERSQSCEHDVRYELTLKNLNYEFTIEMYLWNL